MFKGGLSLQNVRGHSLQSTSNTRTSAHEPIHSGPGVYVVTLTNEHPISVNADRLAIAERCIKVTREHCKFGKAMSLHARRKNYNRTFGAEYVRFHPLAAVSEPAVVESLVATALSPYRIRGATGRPNEWLAGVSPKVVEAAVLAALAQSGLEYTILGTIQIDRSTESLQKDYL